MTTPALYTYNGYKIASRFLRNGRGEVAVYDPRYKRDPAVYKTTSMDLAMKWVDAYLKGEVWATQELCK